MAVLSTVEAQLPLHELNVVKEPRKHGNAKPSDNYEPGGEVQSNLHVPYASVMIQPTHSAS